MKIPKWLFIALIVLIVLCLLVTFWALFLRNPAVQPLTPDYAPIEKEENAENIDGDDDTKLEAENGGSAVAITYTDEITIDLSDKQATLYFANPGKSLQEIVLQIVIQDNIIVQSGTIDPGKQVKTLNLLDDAEKMLTEGIYEGKLVAHYYDEKTGEKAMVKTEILVTITVRN